MNKIQLVNLDENPNEQLEKSPPAETVLLYEKHKKIHTNQVKGYFQRLRAQTAYALLAIYFVAPWLMWDDRQAILFDITKRQFHVFAVTFWPQDFYILSLILMIAAFALFTATVWAGRVWCGYVCPQTVWTELFTRIERWCEGSRNKRIKSDAAKMTGSTLARKSAKHVLWLAISLLTGATFVAYFSPAREIYTLTEVSQWEYFWIAFFTLGTYYNAGFLREQVCKYMCPYARFQSAMITPDSLIVTYNEQRGEPRGSYKASSSDKKTGNCIDCMQCVHACPVGIDIRDGLQMECINCGLCIDACDEIMAKVGYPKNLISYISENETNNKQRKRFNPKLIGYAAMLLLMIALLFEFVLARTPLNVDVERERGKLFHITELGNVENIYTLKLMNMDQQAHSYNIKLTGLKNAKLMGASSIDVEPGQIKHLSFRISAPEKDLESRYSQIEFIVRAKTANDIIATAQSKFIAPARDSHSRGSR